ncbi:hypothetical protein BsWGS_26897 [Bradybaena similaris]
MTTLTEEPRDIIAGVDNVTTFETQTTPTTRQYRSSSRSLVYVTRRIPQQGMDILLKACDVKQWDAEQAVPRGEMLYSVVGVEGILCMPSDNIDADVLDAAGPGLRVVATISQGTQHIDVDECHRRGIRVITCPKQPTETLAELTVALVLLTIKESQTEQEKRTSCLPQSSDVNFNTMDELNNVVVTNSRPKLMRRLSEEQLAFQWTNGRPGNMNCPTWRNIVRKTFGIYGMTKLGINVAKILKNVGACDVLIADKDAELDNFNANIQQTVCEFVSFEKLLEKSDVICVCGSVGEQSKEAFNRDSFQKMKNQAILIASQSQEDAIDYVDLYTALRDGKIKAVGLNDCNQEPVPLKTLLLGLKNCTFLPQTEESVYDMRHKVSVLIAKNLTKALKTDTK